ncbi:hypothetical protein ISCGN_006085, partial [Ixodes scapularis]
APMGHFFVGQQERIALNELKSDSSIMILKADKGKRTVVLDRDDYMKKMYEVINDSHYFVRLSRDPAAKSERELVDHLRELKKKGRISDDLYRRLFSFDAATPKMYGLPKIHKPGCPLRPIVSFISSSTYSLSKYLVMILRRASGIPMTLLNLYA